jgi:DNA polymerase elongation subunit (family B)
MHNKVIKIFNGFLSLILISIAFNLLVSFNILSSINNAFIARAQEVNSSKSDLLALGSNHTALSLIPLMIKEMQNTNATTIPIKQVINATPSNVTALQNIAKHNILNNISNNFILNTANRNNSSLNITDLSKVNNFNPANKTTLIPFVVNLTKNTNATDIAMAKTIKATPSNVTALQNLSKHNILNNINKAKSITRLLNNVTHRNNSSLNITDLSKVNNFNPANKTTLIPFVVNLTKNTNATDIAMAKTINATPSNVTALQNIAKHNILNNISNTMNLSR